MPTLESSFEMFQRLRNIRSVNYGIELDADTWSDELIEQMEEEKLKKQIPCILLALRCNLLALRCNNG